MFFLISGKSRNIVSCEISVHLNGTSRDTSLQKTGVLKRAVTRGSVKETGVRPSTLVCNLVPLGYHNNVIIHLAFHILQIDSFFIHAKDLRSESYFERARASMVLCGRACFCFRLLSLFPHQGRPLQNNFIFRFLGQSSAVEG